MQPLRCNNPDCTLQEGGRCARIAEFPDPLADCIDLVRDLTVASVDVPTPAAPTAPWSGRHLASQDAEHLLWHSSARLVAVLGPYNAGKTSLLTSFFLQLANGQGNAFPYRFASSRTLHGFRELMDRANQWSGSTEADIVLHTTVGAEELQPRSFLHVGLRPKSPQDNRHIDMLLSDLPGEWVKAWTGHVDEAARQRMAFIQRCDAFIIVADAYALTSPGGARTDSETSLLVRRVIDFVKERKSRHPLALVLSKFDRVIQSVEPPPPEQRTERNAWGALGKRLHRTWAALDDAQQAGLPVSVFPVSSFPYRMAEGQPIGIMEPFIFIMHHADRRERWNSLQIPIAEGIRGFAMMCHWRDDS
ncbi:GTPase domain-containing protein [Corallococcus exercitus]|uniref:GTPase domain-containing protein n=1 Tax=Corallococcus exercitus TaxID=2316736 RepID=A0A7Y4NE40_9BACT|nr:GTPase domain-containing protein [Corallococcus exercitus]NOK09490.1 GTPase domain-containing protein [Corallococcus exercitus]